MKRQKELEKVNGKVCCPECLEGANGYINKVVIKVLNKEIFICDECEAVWENEEDITKGNFQEFENFMKALNLTPRWNEFSIINEFWYRQ